MGTAAIVADLPPPVQWGQNNNSRHTQRQTQQGKEGFEGFLGGLHSLECLRRNAAAEVPPTPSAASAGPSSSLTLCPRTVCPGMLLLVFGGQPWRWKSSRVRLGPRALHSSGVGAEQPGVQRQTATTQRCHTARHCRETVVLSTGERSKDPTL
ncbi:hypothetical protein AALO_G00067830 [Alosa alosa]|uniref:Uncharacterized protein n=1 Tax=Alosa alosa TaxID=278164 RepID=A0AAV6H6A6_9TELE|nr:hypothetical protein AALO_G00067830 [Alosa alosa]